MPDNPLDPYDRWGQPPDTTPNALYLGPVGSERVGGDQSLTMPSPDVSPVVGWYGQHPQTAAGRANALDLASNMLQFGPADVGVIERAVAPMVPKEFAAQADAQAQAEGKRTIDATGLHFLDGNKPVYAWNGADPTPVLGSRAADLSNYPSVSDGGFHVWYKPGEKSTAQRVLDLSKQLQQASPKDAPDVDRQLGLALGYPADNVERYIGWKYGGSPAP